MDKQIQTNTEDTEKKVAVVGPSHQASLEPNTGPPDSAPAKTVHKRDAVTGLHNQGYLCYAIDKCLQQGRRRRLVATLALLQLENFYEIRRWVGKSEANLLLNDIAQVLKNTLPENILLCRCHNYEFAVLLIANHSVNARLITDKVKQALLCAVSPSIPPQLELRCGVGLAALEPGIPTWAVVFARARHNLSLALHHRELPAHLLSISPASALQQLQICLKETLLPLSFQAIVNLQEDDSPHYEARCALSKGEDKLPTALLFEAATINALGAELDQRIIEQIWELLAKTKKTNRPDMRISINLTHNSIVSIPFLEWLKAKLSENSIWASQLVFQISETDALVAQHHLAHFDEALQQSNSAAAISQFGCTPKPWGYLSLLPVKYVKLDIEMLKKIDTSQECFQHLVDTVAKLHSRDIKVVAPMVEKLSLLVLLQQAKVDLVQGHCLHSPSDSMSFEFPRAQTLRFSKL
jgi:diguanylate cyclase (GGDEF)-like protein